jgi:Leucine-rich repeat (LRR) protein
LILASENGWAETVKMLMGAGALPDEKDNKGRTALQYALDKGWAETVKTLMQAGAQIEDKDKDDVLTLTNGHALPLPEAQPPFPAFAQKHDISVVVEVKKFMELEISAGKCTINWGDDSDEDEYNNIKEKKISHTYSEAGNYTITVDAEGLSRFNCSSLGNSATAIYLNNCPQLERLICYHMKLPSLDISRCTALKSLFCSGNKLTSLDCSKNLALEYLSCENNQLTCLDLSKNTQLDEMDCSKNRISMLNMSSDSIMLRMQCNDNQLSMHELHKVFNHLPNCNSSYGTVNTWYAGATTVVKVFIACGNNPGFTNCNVKIAQYKGWLVWRKAMYIAATLAGTPAHWTEDIINQ